MTMLDDDRLAALLARAGESFDVPPSGAHELLARAVADPRPDGEGPVDDAPESGQSTVGRFVQLAGRHRVLSVAACVVLAFAVAGSIGTLVSSPSRPGVTSNQAAKLPGRTLTPGPVGSTTGGPSPNSAGRAAGSTAQAPASGLSHGPAVTIPTTTPSAPTLPSGAVNQNAKIEQTGSLGISVGRGQLGRTVNGLAAVAVANGGFVASSQTQSGSDSGGGPYGSVTLEVPVASFEAALKQAQMLGRTTSVATKATDVTGQYVDLQARIASLEASRQQYLTIMSKATTVGDVLAVQSQLDSIQSQIEQLQGQLQVLSSETSYSTLSVTVSEGSPPPRPGPLPESGLVRAWHDSIGGFVAGLEGLVRLAGPLLFALLCLAAAVIGGRALWRRYRRHTL